ncbi:MAG: hypothetical protein JWL63_1115 [Rhodocyclales bacterium]|nr:hypothetical protein [Rhodocyclales bacterium]
MSKASLCVLAAGVLAVSAQPVGAAEGGDLRWSAEAFGQRDEARERTLFNPDGSLLDGGRNVAGLATHGTGRWDWSTVAAKLDGWLEVRHAAGGNDSVRGTLSEASLAWTPRDGHTLSGGLGSFRWGTAYIWNPSNPLGDSELNNASRARNYHRDGDRFASYEAVAGKTTYTLAAVELTQRDALLGMRNDRDRQQNERWLAARVQQVFDASDASLVFALRENERFLGLSTSHTVGNALELHGELGTRSQRRFTTWRSITVGPPSTAQLPVWDRNDDGARQKWTTSAVLGGQYTWEDGANLIVEYLHDGNGLNDHEYDALRNAASDASSLRTNPAFADAANGFLLQANRYTGRMRRNYAFVRLAKDGLLTNTDVQTFVRRGLDDDSWVYGWLLRWQASEHGSFALSGEHLRGSADSEALLVPVRNRYQVSFKYDF